MLFVGLYKTERKRVFFFHGKLVQMNSALSLTNFLAKISLE